MKNISLPLIILSGACALGSTSLQAQSIVSDPALTGITIANGLIEQQANREIKERHTTIQALQTSTVAVVGFINEWHKKMYEGLIQVSGAVSDAWQVRECAIVLGEIYSLEREMIEAAQPNPLALGFAMRFQQEMVIKAIQYYREIHQLILKEDDARLLMDAGERSALINRVLTDLRSIKALAATSLYKVRWAVRNGIINTLNPFASFVNRDARIVQDILRDWRF
jgi:hypothetical protein